MDTEHFTQDNTVRFHTENREGNTILYLDSEQYSYSFGYYSNPSWISDTKLVLTRSEKVKEFTDCPLLIADLKAETVWDTGLRCNTFIDYVTHGSLLYYITGDTLYRYDLEAHTNTALYTQHGMSFPHITNDGRWLNWEYSADNRYMGIIYDTVTGETETRFSKRFADPFPWCNHMMICPTDPDVLFFAHEGITFYVSNRLWLAEKGREPRNIAPQKLNANGDLGDCYGHECWAPDGKGLYFVKYTCSPEPPRGICYVDAASGKAEVLYSAYPYWHVSVSPNGRYLGADTQSPGFSGVCLVDRETGSEQMLCRARTNWTHPCHPHPSFSPSSVRMVFHELNETGQISIGIYDINNL